MNTEPQFTDGRSATGDPIIECLNLAGDGTTYQRYEYLGDSIDIDANEKDHSDGDGNPLGSHTTGGHEKGPINIMTTRASHKLPRPGHVLQCDFGEGYEYYVVGKPGKQRARREQKKGSFNVKRIYNPFVLSLLTEAYGNRKYQTQAAGALASPINTAPTSANTRTGGTVTWSMAARPGYTIPGWLSINASTGALSGTAVAGHWEIDIIITETLTAEETRVGFCILDLTIT